MEGWTDKHMDGCMDRQMMDESVKEWMNESLLKNVDRYMEEWRELPGGPVVKNLPSNAGDVGSIPDQGTKIPHALGQLSPLTATKI